VLLGLSSISPNGGFRRTNFETYGGDCAKNIVVNSGDIYVSLKDVTQSADLLGAVARLPKDISSGRLTQDIVRLIAIRKDTPWDYIYWLLRTPQYRNFCSRYATGTTTLGLGRDDFLGYPVPDFTDQRRFIVQALEAIERRHEELSFQSETLESLARAIFKSWFVDFDPVRAKAEGREPEGMDADTAALFPSTFEDSELGPIPQGWTIHGIDTIATFLNGIALQKYPAMEGEEWLPAIKIAQLKRGSVDGADRISPSIPEKYIVQDGDLLFSWSGSLEVEFWTGGKGALNQHLFKVFSAQFPHWFVYLWLRFHLDGFR
jgi:type I restriction enzyme S subunit